MISSYIFGVIERDLVKVSKDIKEHFNMNDLQRLLLGPLSKQFAYGILWNVLAECVGLNVYSFQDFITLASNVDDSTEIYAKIEADRVRDDLKDPVQYIKERGVLNISELNNTQIEYVNGILKKYLYVLLHSIISHEEFLHESSLYSKFSEVLDFMKRFKQRKLLHDINGIDVIALCLYKGFISQLIHNSYSEINNCEYLKSKYVLTDTYIMNHVSKYAADTFRAYIACGYVRIVETSEFDYTGFIGTQGLNQILSVIASDNIQKINKIRDSALWVVRITKARTGLFRKKWYNEKSVRDGVAEMRLQLERIFMEYQCMHLISGIAFVEKEKLRVSGAGK